MLHSSPATPAPADNASFLLGPLSALDYGTIAVRKMSVCDSDREVGVCDVIGKVCTSDREVGVCDVIGNGDRYRSMFLTLISLQPIR